MIEPAGITILFMVGIVPAMISGDYGGIKNAIPALSAVLVALLRISGPLQSMFRSINSLAGAACLKLQMLWSCLASSPSVISLILQECQPLMA